MTDKLRSCSRAISSVAPSADHRTHKGLNNRIEVSHRPTRRREKIMGRFKSPRQGATLSLRHDEINTLFRPRRHKLSAASYYHARADAFDLWRGYAAEMTA